MTIGFIIMGAVFFICIGYRFVTRVAAREPVSSRIE